MKLKTNIRLFISPYFLARRIILKDLADVLDKHDLGKNVLDFGCGDKPYANLFAKKGIKYVGIDFQAHSVNKDFSGQHPDVYFGKDYLNDFKMDFDDDSFDSVVSFQVLEHHKNPQYMIGEIARITKSGGFLLITCPFLGGLHEEPYDYQRLTKYGLREILKRNNYEIVKFKKQGSIFSTISMLLNEYLNAIAAKDRLHYYLAATIYPPFLIFQYIALILDLIFKSDTIFFNQIILAKKIDDIYVKT
ncbi:MAG: methyltransferase domain-containing protein [Candidatus Moraniibacteriota bacterium]